MYDFDAIRTLIQAAGYGTDAQSVTAENQAITAAWIELSGEREWSFLAKRRSSDTLTAGSEVVPLPTDIAVPKSLTVGNTSAMYPLREVSAGELQDRLDRDATPTPAPRAIPTLWAWVRNTVLVWPRPDSAYTVYLDYIKVPVETDFDANNEVLPFLDGRFALVIAWGAMRWLAIRARDQISYGIYTTEWSAAKRQFEQADRRGDPDKVVQGENAIDRTPIWY